MSGKFSSKHFLAVVSKLKCYACFLYVIFLSIAALLHVMSSTSFDEQNDKFSCLAINVVLVRVKV